MLNRRGNGVLFTHYTLFTHYCHVTNGILKMGINFYCWCTLLVSRWDCVDQMGGIIESFGEQECTTNMHKYTTSSTISPISRLITALVIYWGGTNIYIFFPDD